MTVPFASHPSLRQRSDELLPESNISLAFEASSHWGGCQFAARAGNSFTGRRCARSLAGSGCAEPMRQIDTALRVRSAGEPVRERS